MPTSQLTDLPNQLLTIAQICNEYRLGKTTLYEALKSGELNAKVIGKRGTRIKRCDIDAWINGLPAYKPKKPDMP